jgi:hypothetical protein
MPFSRQRIANTLLPLYQLHEGEFPFPINGHEQVELALGGLNLGDVDMEEADRVGLEPLLQLLVALDLRQSTDAVTLKASMQRRARQMRHRRL